MKDLLYKIYNPICPKTKKLICNVERTVIAQYKRSVRFCDNEIVRVFDGCPVGHNEVTLRFNDQKRFSIEEKKPRKTTCCHIWVRNEKLSDAVYSAQFKSFFHRWVEYSLEDVSYWLPISING